MHVIRYSWKLQVDHVIFVGCGQACRKCCKVTNWQYLWNGLSYYIQLLNVVRHFWKLQFDQVIWLGLVKDAQIAQKEQSSNTDFERNSVVRYSVVINDAQ